VTSSLGCTKSNETKMMVQDPRTDNGKEEARVRAVVECARGLHDSCRRGQPEDVLRNLAKEVHDRVLLSAWASKEVQADAVALCEHWWSKHKPGGDALASKTVLFLLAHSLESGKRADVKRVHAMREAIQRFDFEDESIGSLQGLLLRCIFSPHYLHSSAGRRFLSFLFSLHPSFVPQLFATMKNQVRIMLGHTLFVGPSPFFCNSLLDLGHGHNRNFVHRYHPARRDCLTRTPIFYSAPGDNVRDHALLNWSASWGSWQKPPCRPQRLQWLPT